MCNKTDKEQKVHELVKVRTKLRDWAESIEGGNNGLVNFSERATLVGD